MTTELMTPPQPTLNSPTTIDPQQFAQFMQGQAQLHQRMTAIESDLKVIATQQRNGEQKVTVRDVSMSFSAMVYFMVKWAIAAIPAAIVLVTLGWILMLVFGTIVATLLR